MSENWDNAAAARRDLADLVEGLSDEQLAKPSLCAGWSVRDVAGHAVSFIELSLPAMMFSMLKKGFNADKAWDANAKKYSAQPVADIVSKLREHAAKPSAMKSFPAQLTTTDIAIHTQDIRRALGMSETPSEAIVVEALTFCTSHPKGKMMVPKADIAGLRLEATDVEWSWGEGKLVSGTAEAILMGINRRDVKGDLTGDGVADLPTA